MLIDRHENVKTEPPSFFVSHAGHMVMRFTVVSDNGARRTYEMVIEGRMKLVHEERPTPKGLPVLRRGKMNMPEGERMDEIERIMSLSDAEILAEVRAEGGDPEQIAAEGLAIFERAVEQVNGWRFSLSAFRAVLLDLNRQDMTIKELRRLLLARRKEGLSLAGNPTELARHINGLEPL